IEFHWGGATKNGHGHTHLAFLVIDIFDVAVEIGERTFFDTHHLADCEEYLWTWLFDALFHLGEDLLDLAIGDGRGTIARAAQKARDPVGIFHQVPGFVGKVHFDQHVTGKDTAFGDGFFTAFDFHHFFGRNQYAAKGRLQPGTLYAFEERLVHAFFHARIDVDDIPTLAHVCPLSPTQQKAIDDPAQGFV